MVIPISVWIVDSIEATYRDSIESTINAAIQVEQAIEETNANNDEKTLWQSIIDIISNAWDGVSNLLDAAKTITTIRVRLPENRTTFTKTLFLTEKHLAVKPLFDLTNRES